MNQQLEEIYNYLVKGVIIGTVILIPLFFANLTTEFFETPKFILLLVLISLLLITWTFRWIAEGKVSSTRTPLDLPILLLVTTFILSTIFTDNKILSIIGNLPKINGSLTTIIVYALFYFVTVSTLKQVSTVKQALFSLIGSGIVLSVLSLLSYFGINALGLSSTEGSNFTLTGSSFSTTALLAMTLPIILLSLLTEDNQIPGVFQLPKKNNLILKVALKVGITLIITLFAVTIVLIGTPASYIAAAVAFLLTFYFAAPTDVKSSSAYLVAPIGIVCLVTILSFLPLGGSRNIFYSKSQNFSREVQLPFETSWKISVSAFRDSPFWGSGPATYPFDFTTYKPIEFNNTKLWNIRFDSAFNEYLQILATVGGTGLIALLIFTVTYFVVAIKVLRKEQESLYSKAVALSGLVFLVLLALHTSTLVVWVIGLFLAATLMALNKSMTEEVKVGVAVIQSEGNQFNMRIDFVAVICLALVIGVIGVAAFFASKYVQADYHHRLGLNALAANNGLSALNEFGQARNLNPYADLYRLDIAQSEFIIANAIAMAKGPTEASPTGSLTDQDKQNIQTLLSESINEGKAAVVLNPRNPVNYEVLGSIYRQISGVAQNAAVFALDAYGRAIQQDPLNPVLRLTVGGLYYSAKNYDMAIRFFTDAINLKADYSNGYYNLSLALKEKGDLQGAALSAEKTVSLLDPKSQDYQVASNLLASLKDTIASETAKLQNQQTLLQAEQRQTSALQNQKLPKVVDLPKPDNIATPEAVKKPQE